MHLIEYLATSASKKSPAIYTELALGSTAEEAMDQANTHLPKMAAKYGAQSYRIIDSNQSYRIIDSNKQCVGIGPEGFISPDKAH